MAFSCSAARLFAEQKVLSLWECSSTSLLQIGHRTSLSLMSLCLSAHARTSSGVCSPMGLLQEGQAERIASARSSARFWGSGSSSRGNALGRSEEHTSELQSRGHLVCRLL